MQQSSTQHSHNLLLVISIIVAFALSTSCTLYIISSNTFTQSHFLNKTLYQVAITTLAFISITSLIVVFTIKRLNRKLQRSNSRYQQMIESNQDLVWETDKDGLFRYLGPTVETLLGYSAEELLGQPQTALMSSAESDAYSYRFHNYLINNKPYQLLHKTFFHKDGRAIIVQSSGTPIFDVHGQFDGYYGFDRDITDQENDKQFIEHLAYHDQLTGLPNRKLIEKLLQQELSRSQRHERFGALFFIDLDNFKRINDSLGHHVGDQLLKQVSVRISKYIREEDTVGRLGGDEFILLLPEISENESSAREHASDTAYKVLSLLSIPISVENHILNIGGSIGITLFPGDSNDPDELMRHADTAMYLAKSLGKNTFKFYQPFLQEQMQQRISIEARLRQALEDHQLELYYQPQCNLRTGQLTAIEVLVRWNDHEEGMIPTEQFISVAEESGLILKLGNWVMEEACRQNHAWSTQGLCHIPVSINLSAIQFRQSNLKQTLVNVLTKTGMPAELLEIELTENAIMQDYNLALDISMLIKSSGGSIAIDDFGTGYSNLNLLKNLPIDKLKIDRSFINKLETDENNQIICQTIINMARNMKLKTTAEGIETPEQMTFLKENGCDEMQGYLLARAMPARQFELFVQNYNNQITAI